MSWHISDQAISFCLVSSSSWHSLLLQPCCRCYCSYLWDILLTVWFSYFFSHFFYSWSLFILLFGTTKCVLLFFFLFLKTLCKYSKQWKSMFTKYEQLCEHKRNSSVLNKEKWSQPCWKKMNVSAIFIINNIIRLFFHLKKIHWWFNNET